MGVVAQQVSLDQGVGHAFGEFGLHASFLQQTAGIAVQLVGGVARGRGHGVSWGFCLSHAASRKSGFSSKIISYDE
jgi:hypothetical protein